MEKSRGACGNTDPAGRKGAGCPVRGPSLSDASDLARRGPAEWFRAERVKFSAANMGEEAHSPALELEWREPVRRGAEQSGPDSSWRVSLT